MTERTIVSVPWGERNSEFAKVADQYSYTSEVIDWHVVYEIDPTVHRVICDNIECCMGGPHLHYDRSRVAPRA